MVAVIVVIVVLDPDDAVASAGFCAVEIDFEIVFEGAERVGESFSDGWVAEGVEDLELAC